MRRALFGGALLLADRKLQIGPELYGATVTSSAFGRDNTNFEALGQWLLGIEPVRKL